MIKSLLKKPDNLLVLSIFRCLVGFHLLKKIILWWPNLGLLLSTDSFVVIDESTRFMPIEWINYFSNNYRLLIMFHVCLIVFFIAGIGKNYTTFLLYLTVEIIQRISGGLILNGGDNFLKFALLYLSFCNCYDYFVWSKSESKTSKLNWLKNLLTNVFSKSIVIHLCIIYFIAGFSKVNADVWYNGVATHYIFQLERFNSGILSDFIISSPYLVLTTTYFTILWELFFPIVLFNKKFRIPMLIAGLLLHLGIYFMMMINDFALLFMFAYLLFFNDREIKLFADKIISPIQTFLKHGKKRLSNESN